MEKKNMNNKGFSLVELIIVIAIMAVLIGVLAPQYMKYVEKSRQSADLDNIDAIISAVEIYSADPAHSIVSGTVKSASGTLSTTGDVGTALTDAGLGTLPSMKSTTYKDWEITFDGAGGMTIDNSTLATALGRAATPATP